MFDGRVVLEELDYLWNEWWDKHSHALVLSMQTGKTAKSYISDNLYFRKFIF